MIKDQLLKNNVVEPNSRELDTLKMNFSQYFDRDGRFMIDRFQEILSENEIKLTKEGYELKFLGKSYAKLLTSTETKTVITPDVNHNAQDENRESENLYIVGDNLDAIKHLLKSYSNNVKCIYIDPPYNRGKDDFVYPDTFEFTIEILAKVFGIEEDESERILNMAGKSTHSAWLTFMYPRLVLAKDFLADDGVIFISIDDNEQSNLKLICDEIFGEDNFLTCVTRPTGTPTGGGNDAIVNKKDYILVYAKESQLVSISGMPMTEKDIKIYGQEDEQGKYLTRTLRYTGTEDRREDRPSMFYPIKTPDNTYVYPIGPTGYESRWRCSENKYKIFKNDNRIEWKKEVNDSGAVEWKPYLRFYLENKLKQPSNIWDNLDGNKKATRELKSLFKGITVFDNPKPIDLVERIIQISKVENEDIVLDFFSGSATTAEAVMQLNAEDGGNRKYIMVQLPEKIKEDKEAYKAGYRTIDEIGRARIDKAGKKIKKESEADIDYGYKLYRLNTPTQRTLDKIVDFDPVSDFVVDDMVEVFSFDGVPGKETILTTWLNEDGYGLVVNHEKIKLDTYEADLLADSIYIIEEGLTSKDVMELIRIIENHELNISRVVIYPYSVKFNQAHELKKNITNLRNNKNITVIERY